MDRRGFLRALAAGTLGAAAHTLDVDRLLWVPGAKAIVDLGVRPLSVSEMFIKSRFGEMSLDDWYLDPSPDIVARATGLDLAEGDDYTVIRRGGNVIITPEWITKDAIRVLQNRIVFSRAYLDELATLDAKVRA